ncbi:hypothetical protein Ddye_027999 [Dipteronia dyeriana]|uniref:Cytochrome P450 n=1 Tax=Dipteronia dyeriana TaxID=168575 RepID=A0AAD9TR40_9ROSI|nr:hypothetical protein Ddye_027999 [Dipteronia dyeriana]
MESVPSSLAILVSFLLFVFTVLKIVRKSSGTNAKTLNLPPSPPKIPILGNLHQLSGDLPFRRLKELAKTYGPFMHLQLGGTTAFAVSSAEYAEQIFKTHGANFVQRPYTLASHVLSYDSTGVASSRYGAYWREVRKVSMLGFLTLKKVQSFHSVREEEMANLVNWIASRAGTPINFTDKIYTITYDFTSRVAFGRIIESQENFIWVVKEMVKYVEGFHYADLFPSISLLHWITGFRFKLERVKRYSDEILESIINEHKKNRKEKKATLEIGKSREEILEHEDVVDILLDAQEERMENDIKLTTDNLKAVVLDMFTGGGETSATTVDWAMVELMRKPHLLKKAQAEVREVFGSKGKVDEAGLNELNFLKMVIKETVRMHPAFPLIPRGNRESCVINGFDIPANSTVFVNVWQVNRDPERWTDPDTFNPERFLDSDLDFKGTDYEFVTFGAGRRICPGMVFGLATVEISLAMMLYHFDWKFPSGTKAEDLLMTEAVGITGRRVDDLYLVPIPYKNV